MSILAAITRKGIRDFSIVASNYEEQCDLIDLFGEIQPEIDAFKAAINAKLGIDKQEPCPEQEAA